MHPEVEVFNGLPLAIFMGPREIREALEGRDEYTKDLEMVSDDALLQAAYSYLADEDEPWKFLESAAEQILVDALKTEFYESAYSYIVEVEEALAQKDQTSAIIELLELVIREERSKED